MRKDASARTGRLAACSPERRRGSGARPPGCELNAVCRGRAPKIAPPPPPPVGRAPLGLHLPPPLAEESPASLPGVGSLPSQRRCPRLPPQFHDDPRDVWRTLARLRGGRSPARPNADSPPSAPDRDRGSVGIARAGVCVVSRLAMDERMAASGVPLLGSAAAQAVAWRLGLAALGALPLAHAAVNLARALRTRASDLIVDPEGVVVDGGRLHGTRVLYAELTPPYVDVERKTERRLSIVRIATFLVPGVRTVFRDVSVTRLLLFRNGERLVVGESDRDIEADSFEAARATMQAVAEDRRYVEQAPTISAKVIACHMCGAAVIPEDAPFVVCRYCHAQVVLDLAVRGQAAAALALEQGRETELRIVAKLLAQQRARRATSGCSRSLSSCCGRYGRSGCGSSSRASATGFCRWLPSISSSWPCRCRRSSAVSSSPAPGWRIAGALALLTLGFGALAPRKQGELSRCRCCQGPLLDGSAGSVARCRYCHAENIVGVNLRPTVDRVRAAEKSLAPALHRRTIEKSLWSAASVTAVFMLIAWGWLSYAYAADALAVPGWASAWPWADPGSIGAVGRPAGTTGVAPGSSSGFRLPFGIGSYEVLEGCTCPRGAGARSSLHQRGGRSRNAHSKGRRHVSYRWQRDGIASVSPSRRTPPRARTEAPRRTVSLATTRWRFWSVTRRRALGLSPTGPSSGPPFSAVNGQSFAPEAPRRFRFANRSRSKREPSWFRSATGDRGAFGWPMAA